MTDCPTCDHRTCFPCYRQGLPLERTEPMNPLHDEIRQTLENAAANLFDLADALCDQQADSYADAGLTGRPATPALAAKLYRLSERLVDEAADV